MTNLDYLLIAMRRLQIKIIMKWYNDIENVCSDHPGVNLSARLPESDYSG
jgi:hypothetical protein